METATIMWLEGIEPFTEEDRQRARQLIVACPPLNGLEWLEANNEEYRMLAAKKALEPLLIAPQLATGLVEAGFPILSQTPENEQLQTRVQQAILNGYPLVLYLVLRQQLRKLAFEEGEWVRATNQREWGARQRCSQLWDLVEQIGSVQKALRFKFRFDDRELAEKYHNWEEVLAAKID